MRRDDATPPSANGKTRMARAIARGGVGLMMLIGIVFLGDAAAIRLHVPLPGPVIGLALLAAALLLLERFHAGWFREMTTHLLPVGRLLLSHMGLLFVPAGVGILTEGEVLRREWLPLLVALIGSTLIGLATTGWLMHRFAPTTEKPPR